MLLGIPFSSAPILTGCICTAESLVLSHLSEVGGWGRRGVEVGRDASHSQMGQWVPRPVVCLL